MPKILVIEADEQFREMLTQMLKAEGHVVTLAAMELAKRGVAVPVIAAALAPAVTT